MENRNPTEKHTVTEKRHSAMVWILCIVLAIGIAVTGALLGEKLKSAAPDDSDAIELVTPAQDTDDADTTGDLPDQEMGDDTADISDIPDSAGQSGTTARRSSTSAASSAANSSVRETHPEFIAKDDRQVWTTDTRVEIFHIAYDETGEVTVRSDDGEKVFAPGTANSYTFKFKNNGDVALDYHMTVNAYILPGEVSLPIEAKMNCYDGTWLVGGDHQWAPVLELDGVTDDATLGVNRYAYYTLDWQWPFETADENGDITEGDAYDTWLGNQAVDHDITLTIEINVIASANDDPNAGGGVIKTGDSSPVNFYVILALAAVLILILLFAYRRKNENPEKKNDHE